LTGIDFNLTAIAALLTLVGYSVNDKVVVYGPHAGEHAALQGDAACATLIDKSINETLGRSLYNLGDGVSSALPCRWRSGGGPAVASFCRADGVRHRGSRRARRSSSRHRSCCSWGIGECGEGSGRTERTEHNAA